MRIKVLDPIFSKVMDVGDAKKLLPILSYKTSSWRKGPFSRVESQKVAKIIWKGLFLTGFIPSVRRFCDQYKIPLEIIYEQQWKAPNPYPTDPPGVHLDKNQEDALFAMTKNLRGVIHYPTGSGKTEIFLSWIWNNAEYKTLVIVNSQDLLLQTFNRAKAMLGSGVGIIGGGFQAIGSPVTIATYQSLKNLIYDNKWIDYFKNLDAVIVDECHHVSKFCQPFFKGKDEGSYAKILTCVKASKRYGFTGTLPYEKDSEKALEGYIGPVIAHRKIQEVERLAKVKLILKKLPLTRMAKEVRTYPDVYKYGVTYNSRRNKQVLLDTMEMIKDNRTVLILVTAIKHGRNILKLASTICPELNMEFVWGGMSGTSRESLRNSFNKKEVKAVVADAVWKEGVDIPSVGCVINAAGGKSEIMTIQSLGRGLRRVEGSKEDVVFIDYFDPSHRYLRDHFSERITLYFEEGWLG